MSDRPTLSPQPDSTVVSGKPGIVTKNFVAASAIAAGDWVSMDISEVDAGMGGKVEKSPAASQNAIVMGVAMNAATAAGDPVVVQTWGPYDNAAVDTSVAAGVGLEPGATPGRCRLHGTTSQVGNKAIGFTLELAAANVAAVFITCGG